MMNGRKWAIVGAAVGAIGLVVVFAAPVPPVGVFRTVVSMLTVQQGTELLGTEPLLTIEYNRMDGSNLVYEALGTAPTSNQVFAMRINCASSAAALVVYDKSDSNIQVIATSDSFATVKQQASHRARGGTVTAGATNDERFVAQFTVVASNNLAGGFLTVAGRLHLGTNGCPGAVLISLNHDSEDSAFDDKDVTDAEQDAKVKDTYRAGEGHFIGVLNVIESGSTNTWLVPLGHMTFRRELEQYTPPS